MPKTITKIGLSCFRGASQPFELALDPQKDMTMLFGENGSGKSTILDALDIVCNSNLGALEHISAGSNKASYLPTVGKPKTSMSVCISSGAETWTATLSRNDVKVTGPPAKPIVRILRRSRVLDLVIAQPKDRYEAFRRFIDVGVVEASENTLQAEIKETNDALNRSVDEKTRQETQLTALWDSEGRPGPGATAYDWAENKINTGIDELRGQSERLGQVVQAADSSLRASTDYLADRQAAQDAQNELADLEGEIQRAPGVSPQTAILLVGGLNRIQQYIEAEQALDKCPACQRPMARHQLAEIVGEQLARMGPLKELHARKTTAEKTKDFADRNVSQGFDGFVVAVRNLHTILRDIDITEISSLEVAWPDWGDLKAIQPDQLAPVIDKLATVFPRLEAKRAGLLKDINQFNSLVQWHRGIKEASEKAAELDRILQSLRAAYELVHQTRMAWWSNEEVGHNQEAKKESIDLFGADNAFVTPKPERLLTRVIELSTGSGELVLDSFAGSGTTGAVAHKMGRRWIMVELGEHCHTHIIPRLKKVIDGKDPGGVTEAVGWKGGGGFRYYRLAPSLLEKDQFGNWVISRQFNPAMLAEALCKLEGFTYAPSDTVYWQHGHSTENDFIYVTTQTLTREQFQRLSDEGGSGRSLLVMCGAFRVKNLDEFPNLTVKKIPKAVLNRCEWGKDDYSLEIKNLPLKPPEAVDAETDGAPPRSGPRSKAERRAEQGTLFDLPGKGGGR